MTQIRGTFRWTCPHCSKPFVRDTPQGLGLTKSNHLRKHGINTGDAKSEADLQRVIRADAKKMRKKYVPRNYEQYPEEICGEMGGDCMNCPLPPEMRGECRKEEPS